jgi:hypothetical protein
MPMLLLYLVPETGIFIGALAEVITGQVKAAENPVVFLIYFALSQVVGGWSGVI